MEDTVQHTNIINLNTEDFHKLIKNSSDIYVIDFWASWCGPCVQMAPIFEAVSKDENLASTFKFAKINTDENQELIQLLGFRTIPSFFVIKFNGDGNFSRETNVLQMLGGSQSGLDMIQKLSKIQTQL
jgi:thioredoxin-like negative regulator of GroEL